MKTLQSERLILRPWRDRDRLPLALIIGDSEVRRYFPTVATAEETSRYIDRAIARTAEFGFHFAAVERKRDGALIGICGLGVIDADLRRILNGQPAVEVGWQFDKSCWGQGLAPEAAGVWLDYAWATLDLPEIVAITAAVNLPSQRVMEKLGMARDPDGDFEHPNAAAGHALRPHVLYRIGNPSQTGPGAGSAKVDTTFAVRSRDHSRT